MTRPSKSQEGTYPNRTLNAGLDRTSAISNFAHRGTSSHCYDSVNASQRQGLRSAVAVLSLLAIIVCATSPQLLTAADALPVLSLSEDFQACSQPIVKQPQQQELSLRLRRIFSSPPAEYGSSLNSVAIKRRHLHSHCHADHQHKSSAQTHSELTEEVAGIKESSNAGAVAKKQAEERDGHFRPRLDQQHMDFVALAARVSGRSSKSVEKALLKQLRQEHEAREHDQLEKPERRTSQGDAGGLRAEQNNGEMDPMIKTTLKILPKPKGKGQSKAVKGHVAKHSEPEDRDINAGTNQDNRLILKHTKMTSSTNHRHHPALDDSYSSSNNVKGDHSQQQHALKLVDQKSLKCLNNSRCTMETNLSLKTTPTIFYVPHQDDDALAMALAIREHIEAGRKVIVHLYSDGVNSVLRDIIAGTVSPCPLQHAPHEFNVTLQDVVTGRTHEFRQSLRHLGVQDENMYETGWSDIEPVKDYPAFQKKLKDLIVGYEEKYPGASHKCISGEYDRDGLGRNPTHRACWDVARELIDEYPTGYPSSKQLWDFRFYRTYTYYKSPEHREAQYILALPQFLPYKQRALDQYKRWKPSHGELAWGYHSVKALIDASYNDPYVYVDMLDNDPTNPENPSHEPSADTILIQSPEDKAQLLDQLPPKDLEVIRAEEELENEQAEKILERFEQAMRGPEGRGYKRPKWMDTK
ncbi:hypothetical protein CPB97_007303 [Podila verticillata]|nr:hypothetical protein CPB97_007303 [Podila verticillata]